MMRMSGKSRGPSRCYGYIPKNVVSRPLATVSKHGFILGLVFVDPARYVQVHMDQNLSISRLGGQEW